MTDPLDDRSRVRELIIKDGLPLKQIILVTSNKESDKYNTTYEDHNRRISLLISRMNGVIITSSGILLTVAVKQRLNRKANKWQISKR